MVCRNGKGNETTMEERNELFKRKKYWIATGFLFWNWQRMSGWFLHGLSIVANV